MHHSSPIPRDSALIDAFVRRHFRLDGTLRLHRHALGWDLLRAPANVLLSPLFLVVRLSALALFAAGLRETARRLAALPLQFRSDVGRAVEAALLSELVLPRRGDGAAPTANDLRIVGDYVAVRTAVAEIATTLAVLLAGLLAFHAVTPGVLTLAPVLTDRAVLAREIASFPLGDWAGGVWYGLFPGRPALWQVAGTAAALALGLSLVTTFAGLLADPVQAALGVHRRRLVRLLRRIDRAETARPGVEAEFLLARTADLADVGAALLRLFRP